MISFAYLLIDVLCVDGFPLLDYVIVGFGDLLAFDGVL